MLRTLLLAATLLAACLPAVAANPPAGDATPAAASPSRAVGFDDRADKRDADIRRLIDMSGTLHLVPDVTRGLTNAYISMVHKVRPDIPARMLVICAERTTKQFSKAYQDELMRQMVPIYEKEYSDDDIAKLISFYQSPLGKKVQAAQPVIVQEVNKIGYAWGSVHAKEIAARIDDMLKHMGYPVR